MSSPSSELAEKTYEQMTEEEKYEVFEEEYNGVMDYLQELKEEVKHTEDEFIYDQVDELDFFYEHSSCPLPEYLEPKEHQEQQEQFTSVSDKDAHIIILKERINKNSRRFNPAKHSQQITKLYKRKPVKKVVKKENVMKKYNWNN